MIEKIVKLRDLSKYDFRLSKDGGLYVTKTNGTLVLMQGAKSHTPYYRLVTDSGATRTLRQR